MPTLTTDQLAFAALSRSPSRSGQERKALVVEAAPSVIESPRVTSTLVGRLAATSTRVTSIGALISRAPGRLAAAVKSPLWPAAYWNRCRGERAAFPCRKIEI